MRGVFSARDEISSTKKLLELIRGDGDSSRDSSEAAGGEPPARNRRGRNFLKGLRFFKKHVNVGLQIGHTNLTLVKVQQLSESRYKLLDYKSVPFNPNIPIHSQDFYQVLKSAVTEFCGFLRNVNLWTSISSTQVDMNQVGIPRVAKKELFRAVYWTAKREMHFDEKESILDFEIQGEAVEDGVPKMKVMNYTAPLETVNDVKGLFAKSGLPLAGLTTTAFSVQNLFRTRWLRVPNETTFANLYLSEAYSRIAVFSEGNLVLTREIKSGVDSLIISAVESFNDAVDNPESLDALEQKLDVLEMNWEKAKALLFSENAVSRPSAEESAAVLSNGNILEMVGPALERLIRQIERTFEFYSRTGKRRAVEKLFISGAVSISDTILNHISQSLAMKIEILDPLNPVNGYLADVVPPDSVGARAVYTSTLGLALSGNQHTPNLLFTFEEKEKQTLINRINHSIFAVFMSVILILGVYFFWQEHLGGRKRQEMSRLQQQLAQYNPTVDQDLFMKAAARIKSQQQVLKAAASEYLGVAVLSELSAVTPGNIRLISITADLGRPSEAQAKEVAPGQKKGVTRSLVIDGIVQGDGQTLEASLARYLMKLGTSPLFVNPTVHASTLETYQEIGEALHFVLKMGLLE